MKLKIDPDLEKAKALLAMADVTLKRLHDMDINKYPSNTLNDYYDIIHKILEALVSIEGIKIKGESAHQQLIDYVCKQYKLGDANNQFLQDMREFRNRIQYEGFMVNENYISTNSIIIEKIISDLKAIIDKQLI